MTGKPCMSMEIDRGLAGRRISRTKLRVDGPLARSCRVELVLDRGSFAFMWH